MGPTAQRIIKLFRIFMQKVGSSGNAHFMDIFGPPLGMVDALLLQIAGLLFIQTLAMVWMGRQIVAIVNQGLMALDSSIAAGLKQIIEGGMGEFEPPNPILAAIASRMMQNAPLEGTVLEKDERGRFV